MAVWTIANIRVLSGGWRFWLAATPWTNLFHKTTTFSLSKIYIRLAVDEQMGEQIKQNLSSYTQCSAALSLLSRTELLSDSFARKQGMRYLSSWTKCKWDSLSFLTNMRLHIAHSGSKASRIPMRWRPGGLHPTNLEAPSTLKQRWNSVLLDNRKTNTKTAHRLLH